MSESFIDVSKSGNEAIQLNLPTGLDFHITKQGSDWLWAVFSIFGCFLLCYLVFFFYAEIKGSKLTRYAVAPALLISFFQFFAYFTYASDLGWTGIEAEFNHITVKTSITGEHPGVRQIFYSKYCAWFLSYPCLLFLLELSGLSSSDEDVSALDTIHSLLMQMIATEFWVVSLLVGALIKSTYKWGYWTFGAVAMLLVQGVIIKRQFFTLNVKAIEFKSLMLMTSMLIVWLYFICWGISEGGNVIQPDGESVFYGVLDLCMFAVYPAFLVFTIAKDGKLPNITVNNPLPGIHKHHENENDLQEQETDSEDEEGVHHEKEVSPDSPRASGATAFQPEEDEAANVETST
ncbi:opsin family protein NDAI_0E00490 [Naumovozyma dairenensis CBS 421]|uniref:30 kDa heat shock protein n=1 Tax=Naumovozyma dairenensis (strain ATCC 10597 / BCRC 20456 / CBS 421 / NBRC 0211 / NRRL Y-12639) TaxID=1071378 RepID=G0WAU5_NAUDC|nr:hypothetical protein NDAI_0E00490 [Naumovozyma dairenensis CBS 421]CCD24865.1 hypothetical protein NDAI_0E00490 [Naumovozyma dairenensis CBS 421]